MSEGGERTPMFMQRHSAFMGLQPFNTIIQLCEAMVEKTCLLKCYNIDIF